jgi:hypothetical protein
MSLLADSQYAERLRRRAGNLDAAAFCSFLGAAACGVGAVAQAQTRLFSSGTGTPSLALMIAWALIAVVLGAVGAGVLAVGILVRTLADSAHSEALLQRSDVGAGDAAVDQEVGRSHE